MWVTNSGTFLKRHLAENFVSLMIFQEKRSKNCTVTSQVLLCGFLNLDFRGLITVSSGNV